MKTRVFLIPALTITMLACNRVTSDSVKDTEAILQTDKAFSDYCAQNGQAAAFIKYADSSLIELKEGALPIRGITALKENYAKRNPINKLTWEPEKAEASGNLGYSFGWWKYYTKTLAGKDTIYQGDYMTVWKRQKDNSWKYVLDGGNNTPAH